MRFPHTLSLHDARDIHSLHYHFERSEKSSLHSALSCSFRKRVPLFRAFLFPSQKHSRFLLSHIRRYTGVQERSRASLGMTLQKWHFPNISFIRDVGYPSPPYRHFERSREIFLALCSFLLPSQKVSPFPLSHIRRYTGVQERSLGFARDDDTGIALSQHILYTMRGISPYDAKEKSPSQSWSFFCVRKTYLPNCASMVPAATAVPITPATFGPIACISR